MGLLDLFGELPDIVKYIVGVLTALHVLAFVFYLFLLAKTNPQTGLIGEGIKKLKEAELKAKKGNKLE